MNKENFMIVILSIKFLIVIWSINNTMKQNKKV